MPELPEVETVRSQLAQKIIGKRLGGKKIVRVRRRGKLLIIDLEDGCSLVFHLKLTGQLILQGQPSKYTRKVFELENGGRLIFNDVRGFAWWKLLKSTKEMESKLGPEPLEIILTEFKARLAKRPNAKIKPLLMDQKFIAGIGNIYSDEILFVSGVRPTRRVKTLTQKETEKIFQNIKKILKAAIKLRGSSFRDYVDAYGKKGDYVNYHYVYHKEKCSRCGARIKKIKMGGRSAHFCPKCQS